MKFLHIEVSLKVIVDIPLLKKYLLQTIIPCVDVENYVTCCEVLNLTYFPSMSSKKYYLFVFSSRKKDLSISVWRGIDRRISYQS